MSTAISDLPSFVNRARAVRRLQEMVRIPAVAGEERPMAEDVAAALRDVGCSSVHVDDHWNVLGIAGEGARPSVMFLTHTDSAPAGPRPDAAQSGRGGGLLSRPYAEQASPRDAAMAWCWTSPT